MTARRDAQHPGGEPVSAGKPAPVAEKAAAIDAAQAHPLTRKTVIMRALAVGVAGAALYLVLPKLIAVLGAWPRLSTLNPAWFAVCLAADQTKRDHAALADAVASGRVQAQAGI